MNDRKIALVMRLHDPCMSSAVCVERIGLGFSGCLSVYKDSSTSVMVPSPICLAVEGSSRLLGSQVWKSELCFSVNLLQDFKIQLKSMRLEFWGTLGRNWTPVQFPCCPWTAGLREDRDWLMGWSTVCGVGGI